MFTCVTGVSGSGKSSLVNEVVKKTLLHDLNRAKYIPKDVCDGIEGIEQLDKIIDIDQSPTRPHAPQQPGYIYRPFRYDTRRIRHDARCEGEGLQQRPLQLQRKGRKV